MSFYTFCYIINFFLETILLTSFLHKVFDKPNNAVSWFVYLDVFMFF